jgi:hypothetical protein
MKAITNILMLAAAMGGGLPSIGFKSNPPLPEPDEETIRKKGLQLFEIEGRRIWAKNEDNAIRSAKMGR